MKKFLPILHLLTMIAFWQCAKKAETTSSNTTTSSTTSSTPTSNNSTTGTPTGTTAVKKGSVSISATWTNKTCWSVKIGLAFSSTDIANDAFFTESNEVQYSPIKFTYDLDPGTYYYKASKNYFTKSPCGGSPQNSIVKNGSFVITSGKTTVINAGQLD